MTMDCQRWVFFSWLFLLSHVSFRVINFDTFTCPFLCVKFTHTNDFSFSLRFRSQIVEGQCDVRKVDGDHDTFAEKSEEMGTMIDIHFQYFSFAWEKRRFFTRSIFLLRLSSLLLMKKSESFLFLFFSLDFVLLLTFYLPNPTPVTP